MRFPSYGSGAKITAVTTSGSRIALKRGGAAVALRGSATSGCAAAGTRPATSSCPLSFPDGAETAVVKPGKQSSAPLPGLTLLVRLASDDRKFDSCKLKVAMAVADTSAAAASVAQQLGART